MAFCFIHECPRHNCSSSHWDRTCWTSFKWHHEDSAIYFVIRSIFSFDGQIKQIFQQFLWIIFSMIQFFDYVRKSNATSNWIVSLCLVGDVTDQYSIGMKWSERILWNCYCSLFHFGKFTPITNPTPRWMPSIKIQLIFCKQLKKLNEPNFMI